jgi:general secretion pathway protein G
MMSRMRTARGFSLVEIAIVLAIAGVLIAIIVPRMQSYIDRNRVAQAIVEIGEMSSKIRQYEVSKAAIPDTLDDVGFGGRVDPWSQPYEYVNLRTSPASVKARKDKNLKPLNSDYDLYSIGADGLTAASLTNAKSRDDIIRARDGAFIGTAAEFDP